MVFQNDILAGAAGAGGGYTINQSIRFNDNDTPYLTRTPSSNGNRQTFTWSGWVKIGAGAIASNSYLLATTGGDSDSGYFTFYINATYNSLSVTGFSTVWKITSQVFRDPSAWYHIVVRVDSTNATANNRIRIYVNGEQVTNFQSSSNPSLNHNFGINTTSNTTYLFSESPTGGGPTSDKCWDGYGAEINFIDGQSLAPTDFGEYNDDGVWIPKAYEGTYGTNGFYLKGQDSSNFGDDSSGNGNDFTSSGLTSDDQVTDSPTDNFVTWNPLVNPGGGAAGTFSNGNLDFTAGNNNGRAGTIFQSSGKWYVEWEIIGSGANCMVGIVSDSVVASSDMVDNTASSGLDQYGGDRDVCSYYGTTGAIFLATTNPAYGDSYANGDIIGMALDLDTGAVWFSKNGTWQNSATIEEIEAGATSNAARTGLDNNFTLHFHQFDTTSGARINAGQFAFTYTQPTGFNAWSTANLPTPTITDGSAYFQTTLYTGNGSTQEINQSGNSTFQPSWVWIKERNGTRVHSVYDEVRGVEKYLQTNEVDAESTSSLSLTSFDADGFTLGSGPWVNNSGNTYVGWQWLAGNGTASNEDGSITSTVSANTTAGFSVVSYTGNGTAGATVGHGLGVAPDMLIVKNRDNTEQWIVYHQYNGGTKYLLLNSNAAVATSSGAWNNTDPSSSVVTLGGGGFGTNISSDAMIMYAFAEIDGFSKTGSYTGNGSAAGPYIWCGFRPAFIIVKENTSADDWLIYDSVRDPYNVAGRVLRPDSNAAEFDGRGGSRDVDFLSNGFKFRSSNATMNGSGVGYIFMAFAEHPFGGDGVAPVPAR